jgi:hypothetical protein
MIAAATRDLMAVFFYEAALGHLRELHLRERLEGYTPGPGFWKEGEKEAWQEMKRRYYGKEAREYLGDAVEPGTDDATDFENRTQKLTEIGIVMTHGILKEIPYVGHPEYRDER